MKATTRRCAAVGDVLGRTGAGWTLAMVGLCAAAWLNAPAPALATPIRRPPFAWREISHAPAGRIGHVDAVTFQHWARYLVSGPGVWDRVIHPPWTASVRRAAFSAIRHDPGGADPMARFLMWKRSLDPARFDHYHPRLVRQLRKIAMVVPQAPQTLVPPPAPPPSVPQEQTIVPPPAVPEPAAPLLAFGMAAWFVWRRRRSASSRVDGVC